MKKASIIIWIAILLLAGFLGWFTLEYTKDKQQVADGPYGVGYTHCPDVCPTTLFEMDGWLQKADPDGTKMRAYFVTVDPERDTPQIMNDYVSNVSKRITGISGDPAKIAEVVKGFRIYAKKVPIDPAKPDGDYTMDHTASVFLLNNGGRFKGTIAYGEDGDVAVKKLENLIKG